MFGLLILILVQAIVAWIGAPIIVGYIPVPGAFFLFLFAVVCAIIVFVVGVIAAQVLRGVGRPGSFKLTCALIFALIGAALATWGPQVLPEIHRVSPRTLVLAGAIIGYLI